MNRTTSIQYRKQYSIQYNTLYLTHICPLIDDDNPVWIHDHYILVPYLRYMKWCILSQGSYCSMNWMVEMVLFSIIVTPIRMQAMFGYFLSLHILYHIVLWQNIAKHIVSWRKCIASPLALTRSPMNPSHGLPNLSLPPMFSDPVICLIVIPKQS